MKSFEHIKEKKSMRKISRYLEKYQNTERKKNKIYLNIKVVIVPLTVGTTRSFFPTKTRKINQWRN